MWAIGHRNNTGFTLLELLVVLCVIGLLSAAGSVVLSGSEGRQISRNALAVSEFLKAVRRSAQTNGKAQRVEMAGRSLSAVGDGAMVKTPGNMAMRFVATGKIHVPADGIVFYPDGSSTGGVIELSLKGVTRRIEVDSQGRVNASK